MDKRRLTEIQSMPEISLREIVEITSEHFVSTSVHSKEIKAMLSELIQKVDSISERLSVLESKQASVFQIEIEEPVDENDEPELTLEEEIELSEADDD